MSSTDGQSWAAAMLHSYQGEEGRGIPEHSPGVQGEEGIDLFIIGYGDIPAWIQRPEAQEEPMFQFQSEKNSNVPAQGRQAGRKEDVLSYSYFLFYSGP